MIIIMTQFQGSIAEEQVVIFDHQQETEIFSLLRQNKTSANTCTIYSLELYNFSNAQIGGNIPPQIFKFENQLNDLEECWTYVKVVISNKAPFLLLSRNLYNKSVQQIRVIDLQNMQYVINKQIQSCYIKKPNNYIAYQNAKFELNLYCTSEFNQSRLETHSIFSEQHQSSQYLSITTSYGIFSLNSEIYHFYQNSSDLILQKMNQSKSWLLQQFVEDEDIKDFHFKQQNDQILIVSADFNKLFLINGEQVNFIKYKDVQIKKVLDLKIRQDSRVQVLMEKADQLEIANIDFTKRLIKTRKLGTNLGLALFAKLENQYFQFTSNFQVYQIETEENIKQRLETQLEFSENGCQNKRFLSQLNNQETGDISALPRILSSALYFSPSLDTQTEVKLSGALTYSLPSVNKDSFEIGGIVKRTSTNNPDSITVSYTTTTSFVSYTPTPHPGSLSINPPLNDFSLVKTHKVGLTLTSGSDSEEYFMNVIVTNSAPVFSPSDLPLPSITLYKGDTKTSKLPTPTDPEGHSVIIQCSPPLPFITFDGADTFTFAPTLNSDVGIHTVTVKVTDTNNDTSYSFQVTVASFPSFDGGNSSFADLNAPLNNDNYLTVPAYRDLDGDSVTIKLEEASGGTIPAWVSLTNSDSKVKASPTAFSDVSTYNLKLVLTTAKEVSSFPFKIIVTNSAPYIINLPIASKQVYINIAQTIDFTSEVKDDEHHSINMQAWVTPSGGAKTSLPSGIFTYPAPYKIVVSPTSILDFGTYLVSLTLTDTDQSNSYSFSVEVPSRPPVFTDGTTVLSDMTVALNSNAKLTVPNFSDPDGEIVTITLQEASGGSFPAYFQLQSSNTVVNAAPLQNAFGDVKTYDMKIVLKTNHETVPFPFKITVTNTAPYLISGGTASSYTVNILNPQTINYSSDVKDNERHTITLQAYFTTAAGVKTLIPSGSTGMFSQPSSYSIQISPTSIANLGTYTVSFTLSDSVLTNSYSFQVDVPNRPPKFVDNTIKFSDLTIPLGSNQQFTVPAFTDLDGETVTISLQEANGGIVPTWVKLQNSNTQLNAGPPLEASTEVRTFDLKIVLTTSQIVSFPFKITTINTAPYLQTNPTPSYSLYLKNVQTVDFTSQVKDNENHPVTLKAYFTPSGGTPTLIPSGIFTQPNPHKIVISPTKIADIGSYSVSFTLSDNNMQTSYSFQVDIPSQVPFIAGVTSFADLTIALNSKGSHKIPAFSDPDEEVVTISLQDSAGVNFPSWAALKNSNTLMEAAPVAFTDVGTHNLKIVMTTAHDLVQFPFTITVTNSAPYFIANPPTTISIVQLNHPQTIDLTSVVKDNENNQIFLKAQYTFAGVTKTIPNGMFSQLPARGLKITISPTVFAELGDYQIDYEISDGYPLIATSSSTFTVVNYLPIFKKETPPSFTMRFNHSYEYILPPYYDPDNNPITVSLIANPPDLINTFATISADQQNITFNPTQWYQFSDYVVHLTLSDGLEGSMYEFTIKMTNSPPRFQKEKPSKQKVQLNKLQLYPLPPAVDEEDNPIIVVNYKSSNPSFVKFENDLYVFTPSNPSTDLGVFEVKFELSDSQLTNAYSFKLEVYNNPPYFKKPLQDQSVLLNTTAKYKLPESEDEEGLAIRISTQNALPDFIKLENGQFTFSPMLAKEVGEHGILVCLTDSCGAMACEGFILTVDAPIKTQKYDIDKNSNASSITLASKKQKKGPMSFQASMYIKTATRDGRIKIKFTAPLIESIPKLIEAIDENSFLIEIKTQRNKRVAYNVTLKDAQNQFIELKLKFSDPATISNQIEPDVIQVIVQDDIKVVVKESIINLEKGTTAQQSLPPQINSGMKGLADTLEGGNIKISNSLVINFAFSIGVQYFWNCLDDFSFLTINSMISMPVPGIVQLIQKVLLNFIYVDILLTDMWLPQLFQTNIEAAQSNGGINLFFEENGFGTKTLIVNLGSTFVYLAVYVVMFLSYFIIYLLSKVFLSINKAKEWMEGILFWKYTLKLFFSQFPPILMASLININDLKFTALIDKVSTILGLFFICALPLGLAAVFYLLNRVKAIDNVEEIVQEDTRQNWVGKNWKAIYMLRWVVTLNIMVFLRSHYQFQIMILISISVLFQSLMIIWRPLSNFGDHWITLFNEVMTSGYLYILIILTDFIGENVLRDQCGQALVFLLGVVVTVNLIRVLFKLGSYLKEKYLQWKLRKQALLNQLGEGKTVSIMPTQNEVFIDMNTTTNHTTDIFSRQPNEESVLQGPKEERSIEQKNWFGKSSVEEEFKIEFDQKTIQKPLKIVQSSQLSDNSVFNRQALNY